MELRPVALRMVRLRTAVCSPLNAERALYKVNDPDGFIAFGDNDLHEWSRSLRKLLCFFSLLQCEHVEHHQKNNAHQYQWFTHTWWWSIGSQFVSFQKIVLRVKSMLQFVPFLFLSPPFPMCEHVLAISYFHLSIVHFRRPALSLSLRDFPSTARFENRTYRCLSPCHPPPTCFRRLRDNEADSRFLIIRKCFFNASSYSIETKTRRMNAICLVVS